MMARELCTRIFAVFTNQLTTNPCLHCIKIKSSSNNCEGKLFNLEEGKKGKFFIDTKDIYHELVTLSISAEWMRLV